jgi:hypothetical protein
MTFEDVTATDHVSIMKKYIATYNIPNTPHKLNDLRGKGIGKVIPVQAVMALRVVRG